MYYISYRSYSLSAYCREFAAAWPGWIDGMVRPYVAAFAYPGQALAPDVAGAGCPGGTIAAVIFPSAGNQRGAQFVWCT
jgi:hypothetical protein